MKQNEKNNILSYTYKNKKYPDNNQLKEINNSLNINKNNILKSFDPIIPFDFKSNKNRIFSLRHKSLFSTRKQINLNTSYKNTILKDINFINNKIYSKDKSLSPKYKKYQNNIEIKKKILLNSLYNKKIDNKEYTISKKYLNKNHLKHDNDNKYINMTQTLKDVLNKELKYLQKQYYLIDKINDNDEKEQKKKYGYKDYADKNIIYNHPQLYYINSKRKSILPKIDNSIKTSCLTEAIPDKEEIINQNVLKKYNDFIKSKKSKKPLFIA